MNRQKSTIKTNFGNKDVELLQQKVDTLRKETLQVLKQVKSFSFLNTASFLMINDAIEEGIDFDEEIKSIEIRLIKRALEITGGSQIQAAKLLNLKHTTLNAKIKRYGINYTEILFSK